MPKLSDVSKSWTTLKRGLRAQTFQALTVPVGKQSYEVVRASLYWASADQGKR